MARKSKAQRRGPSGGADIRTPAQLAAEKAEAAQTPAQRSRRGGRETVDSLVVAFVWAFLIRTFISELFVIPTGSMAPTLMGRHKDVVCQESGQRFRVNSSDDAADQAAALQAAVRQGRISASDARARIAGLKCVGGESPQARLVTMLDDRGAERYRPEWQEEVDTNPDYSGDRVLVSKWAYSFSDPQRWDVVVFKYPGNSQTNYIKRVVALPGEDLRIFQGDLFTRPACEPDFEFQIARKPPEQVLAMRQRVHDTHHEPRSLADAGWPLAWSGEDWVVQRREATVNGAEVVQPAYQIDDRQTEARDSKATRWLRYRHTSPSEAVWRAVLGEGDPPTDGFDPSPSLITDFTPYNTRLNLSQVAQQGELTLRPRRRRPDDLGRIGVHWVGDLIVEADVVIDSAGGEVSLELVEAGDHYGVTIDVATGDATFWRQAFESAERETLAEASTPVRGQRSHRLQLANVDSRLLLWIDGDLIEADASYTTELADAEGPAEQPRSSDADAGDLAPAGLGVAGAAVRVERLRLWRDGYYLATRWDEPNLGVTTDLPPTSFEALDRANWDGSLASVATDPRLWYALGNRRSADFSVGEDQLFVLGDNSGWSLDARLWAGGNQRDAGRPGGPYLERSQLVGKAVCVYWPHAWYSLPFTNRMIPAWPNFGDMRLVR